MEGLYIMENFFIRTILFVLVSSFLFDFLFMGIEKVYPKFFSITDMIPEILKGKWWIKFIFLFLIMFIIASFMLFLKLNYIIGSIIIGFFISLFELLLKKPKEMK